MDGHTSWRPREGGEVALNDAHLARVGITVIYEAAAKMACAASLRAVDQLSFEQWVALDRRPLKEIVRKLIAGASRLADPDLIDRVAAVEEASSTAHELRHMIVHVPWGGAEGQEPGGYDYGRKRLLTVADIDAAMNGCAELKRAAHWTAMRVAELIELGSLPERPAGPGMTIRTSTRSIAI